MSTVRNMMATNFASTTNAMRNEISELRKKISENNRDTSLTAEQRAEKNKEHNEQIDALNERLSTGNVPMSAGGIEGNNWLFNNNRDQNQTGFDFFFGAGASMATLMTMNSARQGIENRARTLLSEIRMDQLRGVDTSFKREQLSNLTESVNIMNQNLSTNVDRAVAGTQERQSSGGPAIIDRINADLRRIQEAEEKRVQEQYGSREAPKETPKEPTEPSDDKK